MSASEKKDDESDIDETQILISKLKKICKIANDRYPSGTDHSYFSSYPTFNEQSNKLSNDILNLLEKVCNFTDPNNQKIRISSERNEYLRWQTISDSADHCVEQIDTNLDKIREQNMNQSLNNDNHHYNNGNNKQNSTSNKQNRLFAGEINDNYSLELLYPQRRFLDIIDNKRNSPFKPNLINGKTNSQKSWNLQIIDDGDNKYYPHPYKYEIENIKYKECQLKYRDEEEAINVELSSVYWIETENALSEMCQQLNCCYEISVDLEHHSKYTYAGLTCLMQISSRSRDYIIDTLALRRYLHIYLNPIFTNPKIVKIFHGAMMDIQWLQRDFSCYIVNLFDTFEASKLLNLPQKSLKYLLKTYCDIDTNKQLRMTDWRIRPLRPELIEYARKDTHYLLYIYDHFTNKLIQSSTKDRDLLKECYSNSSKTCLIRYEKPHFDAKGWQYLCQRKAWYFINNKSLNALSKLYEWRDRIGRELDQSIDCVLSNKLLKQISNDLPQNEQQLLKSKKYYLSVIARRYYKDILNIINESINTDDKDSIDPMFEVSNDDDTKKQEKEQDLNEICNKNDGCFVSMNASKDDKMELDESVKSDNLNMISIESATNKNKNTYKSNTENVFFPKRRYDDKDNETQKIANDIFNQISNEPISKLIQQSIKWNEMKGSKHKKSNKHKNKKKNKRIDNKSKKKHHQQPKLKQDNFDRVATAGHRDKIFGSRFVDRNSKKDVFKLPRTNDPKKRKRDNGNNDNDNDEMTLENIEKIIEPLKKKRKISHYQRIQNQLRDQRKQGRMNRTTGVEDEWPMNKQQTNKQQTNQTKKKRRNKNKNKNKNKNDTKNKKKKDDDDIEMTESDILDAAPVPVLDTSFDNVYNPFKS